MLCVDSTLTVCRGLCHTQITMIDARTSMRITPSDAAIIAAIQRKLGFVNASEVMRLALRTLAEAQGLDSEGNPKNATTRSVKR